MNTPRIFHHPAGLFLLFFTEMWERFSYYGMRALLVLFLVSEAATGGWEWTNEKALSLYAMYTGLVYVTPIIGGILADKVLGFRRAVLLGAFLMTCGHGSMALETPFFFYLGLALLVLGNGFFKPNISSIVGQLYSEDESKLKDAAYTIFYMGINAGAFLGILLCGYIGEKVGWSYGFGLAGIFMFFGMMMFYFGQGILGNVGSNPGKKNQSTNQINVEKELTPEEKQIIRDRLTVIFIFSFFTIFFWMAFEQAGGSMTIFAKNYTDRILSGNHAILFTIANTILTLGPLLAVTFVLFKLVGALKQTYRAASFFITTSFIIIWLIAGWMLLKEFNSSSYEFEYALDDKKMGKGSVITDIPLTPGQEIWVLKQKDKFKFLQEEEAQRIKSKIKDTVIKVKSNETEVPASWFGILNSFFIIAFAPLFSKIWESKYNPSGPVKFGFGLILLGLGFGVLAYGGMPIPRGAESASVSMIWLILAYWLHTLGELCISPVGLSYVSKLAPPKLVGLMFGIWFGFTALANYLAGWTGSFIDKIVEKYSISTFFLIYTAIPILAGLIMIAISNIIIKKMHGLR